MWVSVDDEQVEADGRGCNSVWDGMVGAKFPATGRCVQYVVEAKRGREAGETAGEGWGREQRKGRDEQVTKPLA